MKSVLVLLADWANGIFALLLAAWITDTALMWWHVPIALLLSHLPDIDALPELWLRGKVAASSSHRRDHRTLLHYPVLAFAVGFLAVQINDYWGLVLAISLLLHLVNDFYGTGWGLQLFWPLSTKYYKLLGRRVNRLRYILVADGVWEQLPAEERRLRFITSWSTAELPMYISRWGMDDWIEQWYLRLNWVSGIEYLLFVIACIVLIASF